MRDLYVFVNQSSAPKAVLEPITTLLKSWDMSRSDYKFLEAFHEDGILDVTGVPVQGHEDIKNFHDAMINPETGPVVGLQHQQDRIFLLPGGDINKIEATYTGKMSNFLIDKQTIVTDYATWVVLSESKDAPGKWKIEHLKVFSNTVEVVAAIEKVSKVKRKSPRRTQ